MAMRNIIQVAQRELVETIRTRTFIFGAVLPLLMVGGILFFTNRTVSHGMMGGQEKTPLRVAVLDATGWAGASLTGVAADPNRDDSRQVEIVQVCEPDDGDCGERLAGQVQDGSLDAYVEVPAAFPAESATVYTKSLKLNEMDRVRGVERLVNRAAFLHRAEAGGFDWQEVERLRAWAVRHEELGATPNGRGSKEGKIVQMMAPFAFVFLMLMAIMTTGQYLLSNVIEEKSSRIVEVLLSAVRPGELMAGKIIGLGLVGLMVAGLWLGGGLVALEWRGIELDLPASIWAYFLVYYVLGYLLLASLMAGAGSLCSEPKEAASLIGPINMILIIPMIGWYNFAQEPMGLAARLLSFVPPITPLMMMLRLGAGEIPAWEVAATLALLLVSTVGAIWLAGKVFRVGVLMYGKRPGLKTVWRAVRAS